MNTADYACGAKASLVNSSADPDDRCWAAQWLRRLAWSGLAVVVAEGVNGVMVGRGADSIAVIAWVLGGAAEAFGSLVILWRFTGSRRLSRSAEARAQQRLALSFWLAAGCLVAESTHHLLVRFEPHPAENAMVVTGVALIQMPFFGWGQRRLGEMLGSSAARSKGAQSYLCAAQAAAVFVAVVASFSWPGGWWLGPAIGVGVASAGFWLGARAWRDRITPQNGDAGR
ncbi:hypothetical protein [Mycobacterium sp.]|uniref:hypothetical protein n=1 Tax=Mycobacterium sp. TaxID=1785 RepID=UPI0025FF4342|nr:hypothetical protein [Mycobacterium sp.]